MEEKEEKVEEEDGESNWFGLEIPSLTRLNEAFVKLGIETTKKFPILFRRVLSRSEEKFSLP